jgi:hypothetical protein
MQDSILPVTYLGPPLVSNFKATYVWNGLIKKIERLLARLKKLYISKRGRVTLIKCTLSSLPTYFMSLFTFPVGVANRLEKLQCDFFVGWGGGGKGREGKCI